MKRVLLLVIVAIATFLAIVLYKDPSILEKIWLWLVGFIGLIIKFGRSSYEFIEKKLSGLHLGLLENKQTLTLLRYYDDGETTLGQMYVGNKFYCYTLEDSHRESKVPGETRIPAGIYTIQFKKELTDLTKKYQNENKDWFSYHLELTNVNGFKSVYIHSGGDFTETEGCILVTSSLSNDETSSFLASSKQAYKGIYTFVSSQLNKNRKIAIEIKDEGWFEKL